MKRQLFSNILLGISAAVLITSCESRSHKLGKGEGVSRVTNWFWNDRRYGGFEVADYKGQQTPIGMTFVLGGRFTMGATEDEVPTVEANSMRRTVSVSSFYMDETECENVSYREYVYWTWRVYGSDYPELCVYTQPDETVWRSPLAYNEPYVKNYFKMPAYDHYPVVGVSWYKATDFCQWRTERLNEFLLIQNQTLQPNTDQSNEDVYNTGTYIAGQYEGTNGTNLKHNLDPSGDKFRPMKYEDGLFISDVRLPTEAEWEYAALGLLGNNPAPENKRRRGEEVVTDRNTLPWGPKNTPRYGTRNRYQGEFEGNFMRGAGDAMGVAGGLNDNADVTAPVNSYLPNAFGLYNMSGNVNEWVMDTYRPETHTDMNEFRGFRGNIYNEYVYQEDYTFEEKDSLGRLLIQPVSTKKLQATRTYDVRTYDLNNFKDGDTLSNYAYKYGENTLINDSTKVFKGGSWADRAYWLSPGTRRYLQGNLSTATIGFRCVMDRMGSPDGDDQPGGNNFGNQKKHKR